MGTETRIGIATGLLIVVVASVYFFYGSDRADEDLLIAIGPKAEPALIPPVADAPDAKQASNLPATPGRRKKPAVPLVRSAARPAAKPIVSRTPPARPKPAPSHRTRPAVAAPRGRPPAPAVTTTLRSGASSELITAVRDNLRPGAGARGGRQVNATPPARSTPTAGPVKTAPVPSTRKPVAAPSRLSPAVAAQPRSPARDKPAAVVTRSDPKARTDRAPTRSAAPAEPARVASRPPPEVWPKRHKIGNGDTLSDISKRYYATSLEVRRILKANPTVKDPRRLKIGDILVIPAPPAAPKSRPGATSTARPGTRAAGTVPAAKPPASASGRTYRVREGDTFYSIARRLLGSGARWEEVYKHNRSVVKNDPKRLRPGMVLDIPG
ncbi:MAG: LysM peptidoglycan-binding domain-containing protein [Phycisphaerae bacterium]